MLGAGTRAAGPIVQEMLGRPSLVVRAVHALPLRRPVCRSAAVTSTGSRAHLLPHRPHCTYPPLPHLRPAHRPPGHANDLHPAGTHTADLSLLNTLSCVVLTGPLPCCSLFPLIRLPRSGLARRHAACAALLRCQGAYGASGLSLACVPPLYGPCCCSSRSRCCRVVTTVFFPLPPTRLTTSVCPPPSPPSATPSPLSSSCSWRWAPASTAPARASWT